MKVPVSWLKDFVDIKVSAKELAKRLTMTALEVEGIEETGKNITNVVIGVIKKVEKHPNADKLQVCVVFDGKNNHKVITAATNIAEGQKIPLALEGASLATGITIKKTKIRGVDSSGMMCSPIELGISDDAKGITILDENAPLGEDAVKYMDLTETILDVAVLPNRSDCLSIIGIAREAAAALGQKPDWSKLNINVKETDKISAKVEVIDKDLCPRYMAREIKDVKIGPSPKWMQKRLRSAGIRPINNAVDITNYVLIEMGQPLHAFDFEKITGGKIVVRRAKNGEKITTLDGVERELKSDDLLVADVGRPLALAGIMGGEGSEVQESTHHVLLESAYFNPVSVRRAAFKLGLYTESFRRFERGVDWNGVKKALDRAAFLFQEYAGGKVLKGKVDIMDDKFANNKIGREVILSVDRLNKLLGIELTASQVTGFLKMLDYKVKTKGDNQLIVEIPSSRVDDVFREADLCEEVARLFGYENIPSTLPKESIPVREKEKIEKVVDIIKNILLGCGMHEILTYNLVSEDSTRYIEAEKIYAKKVFLDNPLSTEDAMLRNNMIHSMLNVAKKNINHQNNNFGFFEFGKIFLGLEGFKEKMVLAGILCGRVLGGIYDMNIKSRVNADFYYLKGILDQIINKLLIEEISFDDSDHPSFQPGRRAVIKKGKESIGVFGEVSSNVKRNYDVSNDLYYFELDMEKIAGPYSPGIKYKKLSKFPHSIRDVAISIDDEIKYEDVIDVLNGAGSKILKNVELFDRYKSEKVGHNKVSLAYHLYYGSEERTLTDEEINSEHDRLKELLVKKLRAEIR